jgi:hypothetical protein
MKAAEIRSKFKAFPETEEEVMRIEGVAQLAEQTELMQVRNQLIAQSVATQVETLKIQSEMLNLQRNASNPVRQARYALALQAALEALMAEPKQTGGPVAIDGVKK